MASGDALVLWALAKPFSVDHRESLGPDGPKRNWENNTVGIAVIGERVEIDYVRLFEKQGYNVLGHVLVKEIA